MRPPDKPRVMLTMADLTSGKSLHDFLMASWRKEKKDDIPLERVDAILSKPESAAKWLSLVQNLLGKE